MSASREPPPSRPAPPAAERTPSGRPPPPSFFVKPLPVTPESVGELAELAMLLREEQVQARVVHYKAELETSPELDEITAQVVEQLAALRSQAAPVKAPPARENVEEGQIATLARLLAIVFKRDALSLLVEQRLKDVSKRITRLFFESELHERLSGGQPRPKAIHHAEQAMYYVLRRYQNRLRAELEAFAYVDDEMRELSYDLLDKTTNEFRVAFLSRRSPELKRLLAIMHEVLAAFLRDVLPRNLEAFARAIVQESHTATVEGALAYKVHQQSFPAFRQAFERRFLEGLVAHVQNTLVVRLEQSTDRFREETIVFVQSPELYSACCELICDAIYEFLCNEGFLDLPIDWRALHAAPPPSIALG